MKVQNVLEHAVHAVIKHRAAGEIDARHTRGRVYVRRAERFLRMWFRKRHVSAIPYPALFGAIGVSLSRIRWVDQRMAL